MIMNSREKFISKKESVKPNSQKVAIIGIGCRYPGHANNYENFWENLINGKDCLEETPKDRYNAKNFYSKDKAKQGRLTGGRGGYIDGFDQFDPDFFGIGPREAEYMDPQQRKLLEVAWEAMEDGGLHPSKMSGKNVGVFMGGFTLDYKIVQFSDLSFKGLAAHTATGTMMTLLSNRLSYCFNFNGPSMSVDTACSSSLVTVNLACQSVLKGESLVALAGGALLHMTPQYTITESKGGFLSPEGLSRTYDSDANGYVRSEGIGIVALKRLDHALRDNDRIHAVIVGSGVNQDGKTNGITVPNGEAQQNLIFRVCEEAGINPGELQYIEAHGTSTPVGDPIEANALGHVLAKGRKEGDECFIGSVKTNIGHTEAAAGVAGLIKTVLALKNKTIPPHINLKKINPALNIDEQPFSIPIKPTPWPKHTGPARAGVNSFGFGGTNAHVILEEAPTQKEKKISPRPSHALLPLSAKDEQDLPRVASRMRDAIQNAANNKTADAFLTNATHTLAYRRELLPERMTIAYRNINELLSSLDDVSIGEVNANAVQGKVLPQNQQPLVWVFTGMGPQWHAMGQQLFNEEPVYRDVIIACDKLIKEKAGWSLIENLNADEETSKMGETWLAQPANFALQIALAALWRSYGVEPEAIVGHSAGEAAAFYEAGIYTLQDAITIIVERSRLQQLCHGTGTMLAVNLTEAEAQKRIAPFEESISIAAINSPSAMTLAGDKKPLEALAKELTQADIFAKFLSVEVPYHSIKMEPIKDELLSCLANIKAKPAKLPVYLTGRTAMAEGPELNAQYWWENVRHSVRFKDAMTRLAEDGFHLFLELGPHPVLGYSIQECMSALQHPVNVLPSLRRKEDEGARFMQSLAALHNMGYEIDWATQCHGGKLITLPTYPWKQDRYWIEAPEVAQVRLGKIVHPLLGRRLGATQPAFEALLDIEQLPYLTDHRIQGNVLFPAAGYIEMANQALHSLTGQRDGSIQSLTLHKALYLPEADAKAVQFTFDNDSAQFSIASNTGLGEEPVVHATGYLQMAPPPQSKLPLNIEAIQARSTQQFDQAACYNTLGNMGYHYGPSFQSMSQIWLAKGEALAKLEPHTGLETDAKNNHFHPTLLDACFQTILTTEIPFFEAGQAGAMRLPLAIEHIATQEIGCQSLWVHALITHRDNNVIVGNIHVYNEAGNYLGGIEGFRAANVEKISNKVTTKTIDNWLTEISWPQRSLPESQLNEEPSQGRDTSAISSSSLPVFQSKLGKIWLIGDSNHDVARSLIEQLMFAKQDYELIAANNKDIQNIVQSLAKKDECNGIIYLGLLSAASANYTLEQLQSDTPSGTYPLIELAQALQANGVTARMLIATAGAQAVNNGEFPNPLAAAAWGVGRVLWYQELIANRGSLIDLDLITDTAKHGAQQLLAELHTNIEPGIYEGEVAWRQGLRHVCRLQQAQGLSQPLPIRLRSDGCYVVTGAFGALGQLVCRTLAKRGARKIIMMSRTQIPERSTWSNLDSESPVANHIAFIKSLENLGAQALPMAADVSSETGLNEWYERYQLESLPPIRGVFHLAGQVRDTLLPDMTREAFDTAYKPKVLGSYLLHKTLNKEPLDYFVMFASVASLLTTAGQTNYAAGNAFLDALAHYRRAHGLPGIAIDWGPWATGMIEELGLIEHYRNSRGMNSLAAEAGMDVMQRVMGQDVAQLMVNTVVDWPLFNAWYQEMPPIITDLSVASSKTDSADTGNFVERYGHAPEDEKEALLCEHFTFIVSDVLRIKADKVAADNSLNELGLDSLLAIELRARIQRDINISLPVVTLLSGTTVDELLEKLHAELAEQFDGGVQKIANTDVKIYTNENEFPLSQNQTALWFLKHLNPDGFAYNIGGAVEVRTKIKPERMFNCVRDLIQRHPLLRSNFIHKDGRAVQVIHRDIKENIALIDMEGVPWDDVYNHIIEEYRKPYDLAHDPLMRFRLYHLGDDRWIMMKAVHHIISDAISTFTFIEELLALYEGMGKGEKTVLPPIKARYLDYVNWQNNFLASPRAKKMEEYWLKHLPSEIPALQLPIDRPRPAVQTNNGASEFFTLNTDITTRVHQIAHKHGATVFMVLLSAYYALLHRYSGQEDIIVGSPVMGRTEPEFSDLYGYFVNPLPLHINLANNPNTEQLMSQVQNTVLNGLDNQEYPFVMLVDKLGLKHDPSRSAVFQAMFILLSHKVATEQYGYRLDYIELPEEEGQFDITLSAYEDESEGQFHCVFKYNTDLFLPSTIQRFTQHYIHLLEGMLEQPAAPISTLSVLSKEEKDQLLQDWSGAKRKSRQAPLATHLIDQYRYSNTLSVVMPSQAEDDERKTLTYQELIDASDMFAKQLRAIGIGKNSAKEEAHIVGLCGIKSTQLMIALLGVLKSGAAYLPLDPDYPDDRLAYMLEHSAVSIVLADEPLLSRFKKWENKKNRALPLIATQWPKDIQPIKKTLKKYTLPELTDNDLAYLIYTSGSTGKPKAVKVSHGNMAAIYQGWHSSYNLGDVKIFAQLASFSFDVFAGDWLRALCSGGTLVFIERDLLFSTSRFYQTLKNEHIECIECVPAIARSLIRYCQQESLRLDFVQLFIVGSDVWKVEELRQLKSICCNRVINSYGVSEATIDSTYFEGDTQDLEASHMVPIGKPFNNSEVYVLDAYRQPVPMGVAGELWISGEGVSLGYLNAPELTAQRFEDLAFNNQNSITKKRTYCTGDLAQWDSQGRLKLLGRIDNQVKIRGHRVEIGEIENQLKKINAINQAVVTIHHDSKGEAQLCAYCVATLKHADKLECDEISQLESKHLRQYLGGILPTYMIPSWFMLLDTLPLSPNGKVDTNALPSPDVNQELMEPAETFYEIRMAEHWKKLLDREQVGLQQDFFELGGNSIKLIELIYELQKEFNVEVAVSQLFKTSTLYGMAKMLEHVIIGREQGAQPFLHFNNQNLPTIFCFPPAGGHGLIYRQLAKAMPEYHLLAFNYLMGDDKANAYADWIQELKHEGPLILMGYSLGGNLAFEVAKILEKREEIVRDVIILDSYRIAETFEFKDEHMKEFEKELRGHLSKHTGSNIIEQETLSQAHDYIDYSSRTVNAGYTYAKITVLADETKLAFYESGQEGSWHGCAKQVTIYQGAGRHADMLDTDNVEANATLMRKAFATKSIDTLKKETADA